MHCIWNINFPDECGTKVHGCVATAASRNREWRSGFPFQYLSADPPVPHAARSGYSVQTQVHQDRRVQLLRDEASRLCSQLNAPRGDPRKNRILCHIPWKTPPFPGKKGFFSFYLAQTQCMCVNSTMRKKNCARFSLLGLLVIGVCVAGLAAGESTNFSLLFLTASFSAKGFSCWKTLNSLEFRYVFYVRWNVYNKDNNFLSIL